MSESEVYEKPELWTETLFARKNVLRRFALTSSLIPLTVRTLLDVGTGNGAFLAHLEAQGVPIRMTGLERAQAAIDAAVCRSEIRSGSVDKLPFDDQSFELVSALEVIEHLPYGVYEQSLGEIERVAGEYILISVPYKDKRWKVLCPYCGCRFEPNYHMRSFDERKMTTLFSSFRQIRQEIIFVDDLAFAPLLRAAYLRFSRKHTFPETTVCPQCGYSEQGGMTELPLHAAAQVRQQTAGPLKRILPKRKRANWIVSLYQRA